MLEFFFIERGLLRTIAGAYGLLITNKIKTKINQPAYQRPTPVLFLLQLLLLVEFSLFFFQRKKQEERLIAG